MDNSLQHTRKTVGVLINSIDGFSRSPVLLGITKIAESRNINVLFFVGSSLKAKLRTDIQKNVIYSLTNTQKLDGLILWSSSLVHYINLDEYEKFIESYSKIPMISVGIPLKDKPSLIFDNNSSMLLLLNHLIEYHKYTRIAFICGPNSNPDAIARLNAYEEALIKHNIPIDRNLIVDGDFTEQSSCQAICQLINNNKLLPEVIVAANDEMAIGAYYQLKQMGIEVGKDIALTGFDNIEAAKYFSPPFTTVSQPIFEMAVQAMELISDMIDNCEIPKYTYFKGELIIRESCGCLDETKNGCSIKANLNLSITSDFEKKIKTFELNLKSKQNFIINSTIKSLEVSLMQIPKCRKFISDLLISFTSDIIEKNSEGKFINTLTGILKYSIITIGHDCCYKEALHTFRNLILEIINDYEILNLAQNIFYNASMVIGDILLNKETIDKYKLIRMYKGTRSILQNYNSAMNTEELTTAVQTALSCYEITQCYLCIYDKPVKNADSNNFYIPDSIKLILSYNEGKIGNIQYFNTKDLLPDEFLYQEKRTDLILLPLFSNDGHFGFIALDKNATDGFVYETFREQISSTLKSQMLLNERRKAEEELNLAIKDLEKLNGELRSIYVIDELTGLLNRRGFMIHGGDLYKSAIKTGEKFIFLFGDLDELKLINDTYGHKEGDAALIAAGNILKNSIGDDGIAARLGGDEFTAIVTHKSTLEEINELKEYIMCNFNNYNSSSCKPYEIHMSIGFSTCTSQSNVTFESIIDEADKKLYENKHERKRINRIKANRRKIITT